jgi:hypothetical protein
VTRRYFFLARTQSGAQHEFDVSETNESTANAEAIIEVRRWLREIDEPEGRLEEVLMTHSTP